MQQLPLSNGASIADLRSCTLLSRRKDVGRAQIWTDTVEHLPSSTFRTTRLSLVVKDHSWTCVMEDLLAKSKKEKCRFLYLLACSPASWRQPRIRAFCCYPNLMSLLSYKASRNPPRTEGTWIWQCRAPRLSLIKDGTHLHMQSDQNLFAPALVFRSLQSWRSSRF